MTFFESEFRALQYYVDWFFQEGKTSHELEMFLWYHTDSKDFIPRYRDDLVRLSMEDFEWKKSNPEIANLLLVH